MEYLIYAINAFLIIILITSFYNVGLSIALYVSYSILVPCLYLNIGSLSLGLNFVNSFLLFVFLARFLIIYRRNISVKIISPFLFLYFSLFLLMFFADRLDITSQFSYWRQSFMGSCILPFILWNTAKFEPKVLIYVKWGLIISVIISGIYGLILLNFGGLNPYVMFLSTIYDMQDAASMYADTEDRLGISVAKIQSTMIHPMTWCLFLCFASVIIFHLYKKEKTLLYIPLLILVGVNLLIGGVRTGIATLVIGFGYYLVRLGKIKTIFFIFLIGLVILFSVNNQIQEYFFSMFDSSGKTSVSGSSIEMRITQFEGALAEINGREIVGNGYGWNIHYLETNTSHPILLAFESLIFVVICDSGFIGIALWIVFFFLLIKLNRNLLNLKEDIYLADTFIIVFAVYTIVTGLYSYMNMFPLYYTYLLSYMKSKEVKYGI